MALFDRVRTLFGVTAEVADKDSSAVREHTEVADAAKESRFPLTAEDVRNSAASLYSRLPASLIDEYIDPRTFSAMIAAERVLERFGDIYDAIAARSEYYSTGLVISHSDPTVQSIYRDWAMRGNLDYWLSDSDLTTGVYGQSYIAFYGNGLTSFPFCFSPKNIAVGSSMIMGRRPVIYLGKNANGLYNQIAATGMGDMGDVMENEWPMPRGLGTSKTLRIKPDRIYHRSVHKPSFKRYAIPPAIRAWDELTQRLILGEMIKDTIAGLQTQVRLWTIENPLQNEIPTLAANLASMSRRRVYDLVWRKGVEVKSIVPETVEELLADRTWMSMTDRCMRAMGLQLVLSSGELMSGNTTTSGGSDSQTQVLTAITRLESVMQENIRIALWLFDMMRQTSNDSALLSADLPTVYYRETMLTMDQKVRSIVPLLGYGGISIQSTQERVGLDPDIEMKRLEEELPLRGTIIQPYSGFGQVSNGKLTQSPVSPGRPIGPDVNPENARQNEENAQQSRNGRL